MSASRSANRSNPGRTSARVRRLAHLTLAVLAAVVAALATATAAPAAIGVAGFFGNEAGSGSGAGEFNTPRGVAVNSTGAGGVAVGTIYVADAANHRVQVFDAGGVQLSSFGSSGAGAGQFSTPTGVAVDQADGSVYVYDQGNRRVAKYSAAGVFQFAFGAGVATGAAALETCSVTCLQGSASTIDGGFGTTTAAPSLAVAPVGAPNAGQVVVADPGGTTNRRIQAFSAPGPSGPAAFVAKVGASGSGNGQFGANSPTRVAVDDDGRVYAVDVGNNRVQRFSAALAFDSLFATAQLSGSPAPTDVAIDPGAAAGAADDSIFVVKPCTAVLCPGAPVASERRIKELDPAGALVDTHLGLAGIGSVNGLAADTAADSLAISSQSFGSPTVTAHRVYLLTEPTGPPAATIDPVTGVTADGATFSGTVDPAGNLTAYRFEFTRNGVDWQAVPAEPQAISTAGGLTSVGAVATGLEPNTAYQVRLVATRVFGTDSGTSSAVPFVTSAAPPAIGVAYADPDETGARLVSSVNPRGQATTVHVEYGVAPGQYTAQTEASNAGSGDGSVSVEAVVTGLDPDTTYYFRFVATNATGTAQGVEQAFSTLAVELGQCANAELRTGPGANLPHCRAYEQVSPVEKTADIVDYETVGRPALLPASSSGDAVVFKSRGAFADMDWGGGGDTNRPVYIGRRDESGWTTRSLYPRVSNPSGTYGVSVYSEDLAGALFDVKGSIAAIPSLSEANVYLLDAGTRNVLAEFGYPRPPGEGSLELPAGSPDLRTTVFSTSYAFPGTGAPVSSAYKLYEFVEGQVRLVSVQPDGSPFTTSAFPGGGNISGASPSTSSVVGAVSDDGAHVFFNAGNPVQLYRRSGGAVTEVASPAQRSAPDPRGQKARTMLFATSDGERVFFTSSEHLTDDANTGPTRSGADLYRYDLESDRLVDLTATPGGDGAAVQGVLGAAEDGSRVYYVARGQVVPGEGTAGQPNLYLWEDDGTLNGQSRFVTTLAPADSFNWVGWAQLKGAQVTDDGRIAIFESTADIPGHDNGGVRQVYRYDPAADGGAGRLDCISCNGLGEGPLGASRIARSGETRQLSRWEFPRSVSADGRYAFFTSRDRLVPEDSNGRDDAYVWSDGKVSLISAGTGALDSTFYGASADGSVAFFTTRDRLVPQDVDSLVDMYAATIGGGLPGQHPAPRPDCQDDACQVPPVAPPADGTGSGSESFDGSGDVDAGLRKRLRLLPASARQRQRLASGRRVALRVRTTGPGRVTLRAVARLGGRRVTVARGARPARRAGVVRIPMRLSPQARAHVRATGRIVLTVRVNSPGARARTSVLRLAAGSR